MNKKYLMIVAALALTGCNAQIADYVKAPPNPLENPLPPPIINAAENKMKISPGYVESTGSTVSGRFNITPTNVEMTGTSVGAKLSISQSRME